MVSRLGGAHISDWRVLVVVHGESFILRCYIRHDTIAPHGTGAWF